LWHVRQHRPARASREQKEYRDPAARLVAQIAEIVPLYEITQLCVSSLAMDESPKALVVGYALVVKSGGDPRGALYSYFKA
jgi:hypothetical protein